jgi:hypothetical protein
MTHTYNGRLGRLAIDKAGTGHVYLVFDPETRIKLGHIACVLDSKTKTAEVVRDWWEHFRKEGCALETVDVRAKRPAKRIVSVPPIYEAEAMNDLVELFEGTAA